MKFADYTYTRPDMNRLTERFQKQVAALGNADSADAANKALTGINRLRNEFSTMLNLCYIRHTTDTRDTFYEAEQAFFDENTPRFEALVNEYYQKLVSSPFRKDLEEKHGKQLFNLAQLALTTFQPAILTDLQEENKLSGEYVKIKSAAKIPFQGKEYNIYGIQVLECGTDRAVRKAASEAKWRFFEENADKTGEIYDKSVHVRHNMAKKLGYDNFIALGYARMMRSDYDAKMVANYRKQVLELIVPLAQKLLERQRQRLKLDKLKYYDEDFKFTSGNPTPKGDANFILDGAEKMYSELSSDTNRFFQMMKNNDLMDLVNKEGKYPSGYCTYIPNHKSPYIFSNFNGTSGDIDVLTHEIGHAFQVYSGRKTAIGEYNWPTTEAAEIHSMSMEFFTWPWMPLFFGADTPKYHYEHLTSAILFLPYGVSVDEFQHFVYENPFASPQERNAAWRAIEKKYMPHRDYDGNAFLESGGWWHKQNHIFQHPFYYIDYTLAQICAFQFWKKDRENHKKAWADYTRLCRASGTKSFTELVQLANLQSPFEDGCVASVIGELEKWLDSVDDFSF
jgi:M3 family oligoendopeptidase